jgi:hypothetical protein
MKLIGVLMMICFELKRMERFSTLKDQQCLQVKQADVAREAMKRLGHESSSAIRVAQRGSILNFPASKGLH